jgi:hypothetical protein
MMTPKSPFNNPRLWIPNNDLTDGTHLTRIVRRKEVLSLYREVLRTAKHFHWADHDYSQHSSLQQQPQPQRQHRKQPEHVQQQHQQQQQQQQQHYEQQYQQPNWQASSTPLEHHAPLSTNVSSMAVPTAASSSSMSPSPPIAMRHKSNKPTGRPWNQILKEAARKEFDAARNESDPLIIARLIITGRDCVQQIQQKFNAATTVAWERIVNDSSNSRS